jgi:hypothetical protein
MVVKNLTIAILVILLLLTTITIIDSSNLTTGKIVKNNLPKTVLLEPRSGEVINENPYTFKWKFYDSDIDDTQTAYEIQIADNRQLKGAIIKSGMGSKNIIKIRLSKDVRYYWRVRTKDNYAWGKWSGIQEFSLDTSKQCIDGTSFRKCNAQRKYCDDGVLQENCVICGCKEKHSCNKETKICEIHKCEDGTKEETCNANYEYCLNGILIKECEKCGCPSSFICEDNTCIEIKKEKKKFDIKSNKAILKIISFIKDIFQKQNQ